MSTQHFGDAPTIAKSKNTPTLVERILNRLFKKREIVNCDHDLYLHRWYIIRTKAFGLFLHKFVRSDEDRALHDHPWSFIVIPIWRGYIEHSERLGPGLYSTGYVYTEPVMRPHESRVWPILGTRFRRAEYKHRVELLKGVTWTRWWRLRKLSQTIGIPIAKVEMPSWSIFIRFRNRRDWGFHTPQGWIQWNKWWQEKCE